MQPLATAGEVNQLVYVFPLLALAFIALEYLYGRLRGRALYDGRETAATLAITTINRLTRAATAGLVAIPMLWVWQHRLFDIPHAAPWALAALYLGVEFFYYWHHVAMHKVKWFWATHQVHHSAQRFNLSAAIRLGPAGDLTGNFIFYLPLVWIGFHPLTVVAVFGLGLIYQFFLHTEQAPRLGLLEWVFNTPTHHRVHHASNASCLDRNFGNTLIVFDRLFGTFAEMPRDEALRYGLKGKAVASHRPLQILVAGWRDIGRDLRVATSWRQGWQAVFGRP